MLSVKKCLFQKQVTITVSKLRCSFYSTKKYKSKRQLCRVYKILFQDKEKKLLKQSLKLA